MLSIFNRDTSERDAVQADYASKRDQVRADYERQLEAIEAEEVKALAAADKRAEDADPEVQRQREIMRKHYEASERATARLAVLNRLLDAERKRKAPTRAEMAAASAVLSAYEPNAITEALKLE